MSRTEWVDRMRLRAILGLAVALLFGACGRDAERPPEKTAPAPSGGVDTAPPPSPAPSPRVGHPTPIPRIEHPPAEAPLEVPMEAPPESPVGEAPPARPPETSSGEKDKPGLIKVFYATDRQSWSPHLIWYVRRFTWFAVALVGGILLSLVLRAVVVEKVRRYLSPVRWVWRIGVFVLALVGTYQCIRMSERTKRLPLQYGTQSAELDPTTRSPLSYGTLEVSIPPQHRTGLLETPSFWEGDWFEDPKRHMLVQSLEPQLPDEFWAGVRTAVQASPLQDAFVFVHGYNFSFEDGALRTGQIANDLEFKGAPILYSWPSQARIEDYRLDENMVQWTASHLEAFLVELKARSGAQRIHLLAHSMGNRALATALDRIASGHPTERFDQVVLAAPDIPAAAFRQDVSRIFESCRRVTLYASSRDDALVVSRLLNQVARAGEAGDDLVVVAGMDTVDVSAVTGSHSYIGDNGRVLGDLGDVLLGRRPVTERLGLVEHRRNDIPYWVIARRGG